MLASGMPHVEWIAWPALALTLLGVRDLLQTRHSIRRNYPILGHLRFFFEFIRPELRQYIVESDTEARPFSRNQRSVVYQRAKGELDKVPFGAAFGKGITMKMGQTNMHNYMKPLLQRIEKGQIDPSYIISHRITLEQAPDMYKVWRDKKERVTKIVIDPWE